LWYGDKALKEAFSDLYGIACAKEAFVMAYLELSGGSNQWNVSFARVAYEWKVNIFVSFFSLLYSTSGR